jgi:hypothetical protein
MKHFLFIFALSLSPALAQFGWDEEPLADPVQAAVDRIDNAFGTPFIEPVSVSGEASRLRSPVSRLRSPAVPVFRPFVSPVVDVDPLVDQCDLEPEVAQVYRASVLSDSTRHPSPATSDFGEADCPTYLGRLSANPYAADSTANPYSSAGSPYSSKSVNNPYGPYGSPYSSTSARNPYTTRAPKIVAPDGTYLGKLSDNPYDPDSVSNPYGRYGSPNTGARSARDRSRMRRDPQGDMSASEGVNSSTSINNPYSTYGSPYSSQSPNNPYTTQAPLLFGD